MRGRLLLVMTCLTLACALLLSAAPANAACAAAWSCSTSYGLGATSSYNGHNYQLCAQCSRAASCPGFTPQADNWWTDMGACTTGSATPTSTTPPRATATATTPTRATATATTPARATATSTTPRATATATTPTSSGTENFQAAFWTQGDDPCTHRNINGNGQPWFPKGTCSGTGCWAAWSSTAIYN